MNDAPAPATDPLPPVAKVKGKPGPKPKAAKVDAKPKTKRKPVEPGKRGPGHPAPTVGRIVHMYDHTLPEGGHGGQERGPYAAVVSMVRPAVAAVKAVGKPDDPAYQPAREAVAESVDLWVMPPAFVPYERGGVPFMARVADPAKVHYQIGRYWTWPPRSA